MPITESGVSMISTSHAAHTALCFQTGQSLLPVSPEPSHSVYPPHSCQEAASEAICLSDLVEATCIELRPLLAHHQVTLLFNRAARGLPLVFGRRAALRAALLECVEAAIVHARLEVDPTRSLAIEILFATDADQVHLTLRNLGAIEMVTLGEPDSCLGTGSLSHEAPAAFAESRQHVVFPFARMLLLSMGGQVVVRQADGTGVECTLSMPCAPDPAETTGKSTHHAHIYAGLLTRVATHTPVVTTPAHMLTTHGRA